MALITMLRMKMTYIGFQRMFQVAYQFYVIVKLVEYFDKVLFYLWFTSNNCS